MALTKAQQEALDFVKKNEVYLSADGKFTSTTNNLNKRWNNSLKILLQQGAIFKASLRTNNVRVKAL